MTRKSSHSPADIIRGGQLDSALIYLLALKECRFTLLNVHGENLTQLLLKEFTSISCPLGLLRFHCDWSQSER